MHKERKGERVVEREEESKQQEIHRERERADSVVAKNKGRERVVPVNVSEKVKEEKLLPRIKCTLTELLLVHWLCVTFASAFIRERNKVYSLLTFHLDLAKFFFSCSETDEWMFLSLAVLPLILRPLRRRNK